MFSARHKSQAAGPQPNHAIGAVNVDATKPNGRIEREALIDSLEKGDLIRLNGRLRVVRKVSQNRSRATCRTTSITMSIQRCSWTRKPYTTLNRSDLYLIDLALVQKGYGCERGPLEVILQRQIERNAPEVLECCDVIGVLS